MTNDNDSNSKSDVSQGQSSPQSPMIPATPPSEVSTDPKKIAQSDKDTAKELAREFRWVEVAQFAVNGALAIIGIVACVSTTGS